MLRLDINKKYCITSDGTQLMVNEKGTNQSKDSKNFGKETLKTLGYFHELPQCGKFLINHKVLTSDATGFRELVSEIESFRDEVMKALEI